MHVGVGFLTLHKALLDEAWALAASDAPLDAAALAALDAMEAQGFELLQAGAHEGLEVIDAALQARQTRGDPCAPEALQAALQAAYFRGELGDTEGAVRGARAVDALIEVDGGVDDPRRLEPLALLIHLVAAAEDEEEAHLWAAAEHHRLTALHLDADDTDRVASLCGHAEARFHRGQPEAAGALWTEALAAYRAILGDDADDVVDVESNLAVVAKVLGDFASAATAERRILGLREARDGRDSPSWMRAAHNLAVTLIELGEEAEGVALGNEAFERKLAVLGPFDDDTQISGRMLVEHYRARGDEAGEASVTARLVEALRGAMSDDEE